MGGIELTKICVLQVKKATDVNHNLLQYSSRPTIVMISPLLLLE